MFTYGFYNSYDHDRQYNASDFGKLFDGIINDGVFATVGEILATAPGDGLFVYVKSGKAWFDQTWNENDSNLYLQIDTPDVLMDRYDAVVLEVNKMTAVRENTIKIVKGTPSTNPVYPTLVNSGDVHQYPLAYVRVKTGATRISASDITIMVGQTVCPFVTGIIQTVSISDLFAQWDSQFQEWWDHIKLLLNDNVVGELQNQIDNKVDVSDLPDSLVGWKYETIIESGTWTVPNNIKDNKLKVLCCGGGGGSGLYTQTNASWSQYNVYSGGGSGYIEIADIYVTPGIQINCVIGAGGNNRQNGGSTSFGSYLTAEGGKCGNGLDGGDGEAGGGGAGTGTQASKTLAGWIGKGGNGRRFGGGGGGGGASYYAMGDGCGGNGGTYGGGGGSGLFSVNDKSHALLGKGGTYGGDGGGYASADSSNRTQATRGSELKGDIYNFPLLMMTGSRCYGGVSSGGGGFGGNGGLGGFSVGGGGGGGGFGGNGGDGGSTNDLIGPSGSVPPYVGSAGGGGGGGFGGNGGDGVGLMWMYRYNVSTTTTGSMSLSFGYPGGGGGGGLAIRENGPGPTQYSTPFPCRRATGYGAGGGAGGYNIGEAGVIMIWYKEKEDAN